jgi:hypothetical protein
MTGELAPSPLLPASPGTFPVPAIIAGAGAKASEHFLEFFAATIRNKNTRAAYVQAAAQFFAWCEQYQLQLSVAISRLTKSNEIRANGVPGDLALTPKGQKRVIEKIIPKFKK